MVPSVLWGASPDPWSPRLWAQAYLWQLHFPHSEVGPMEVIGSDFCEYLTKRNSKTKGQSFRDGKVTMRRLKMGLSHP